MVVKCREEGYTCARQGPCRHPALYRRATWYIRTHRTKEWPRLATLALLIHETHVYSASKFMIDTGAGVVDADYRGILFVLLFNHSDVDFTG
jgi:dUTPase